LGIKSAFEQTSNRHSNRDSAIVIRPAPFAQPALGCAFFATLRTSATDCRSAPGTALAYHTDWLGRRPRTDRRCAMAAGVGSARGECNRPVDLVRVIGSVANHSSLLEPPDASAITKGLASSGTAQNAKQSPMTFAIGRWAPSRRRIFRSRTSGSAALLALVVRTSSEPTAVPGLCSSWRSGSRPSGSRDHPGLWVIRTTRI
jgi:hypothetical protein